MQQAKSGDKVKVHYHGKLTSGETFDSSEGRAPLEFEIGKGMVIKGFDDGVTGMSIGEKKTVNIPYDEAYGPRNPEMLIEMPKDRFPKDMEIEPGTPSSILASFVITVSAFPSIWPFKRSAIC